TPALAGFDTGAGAVDSLMTASGSGLVVAGGTRSVSRSVIGSARRRVAREEAAQVAGELGPLAGQQQHTDPDQQQTPGPDDETVMTLHDRERTQRATERETGDDERRTETDAVDRGQQ